MRTLAYDHVRVAPSEQIGMHRHGHWELSYVVTGEGIRTIGGMEERFAPGDLVLVRPDMAHRWLFDPDHVDEHGQIENVSLSFSSRLLETLALSMEDLSPMVAWYAHMSRSLYLPVTQGSDIVRALLRMERETPARRLVSLLEILVRVYETDGKVQLGGKARSHEEEIVERANVYLHCNYQREITLDMLARHVGLSVSRLCTLYRQITGQTVMQALMVQRIDMAGYLLAHSRKTVAEICYESGFRDVPYFNRVFKTMIGCTPTAYRRRAAEDGG